jgi:uncharacterized membrane protein
MKALRWILLISLILTLTTLRVAQAAPAVVRAVLFYSPTCPHCHQVITADLPPLLAKHNDQLQIAGIDTTTTGGQALYQAAIQRFNIPSERLGVPTLIVGDVVLVGSLEIPQQFPGLIEDYLAHGGTDWPDIPGLADALSAQATPEPTSEAATLAEATSALQPNSAVSDNDPLAAQPVAVNAWSNIQRDPIGNGLAIVVLCGMIVSVMSVLVPRRTSLVRSHPAWREWAIPALCLIGLTVAGYLAYVETAQVEAVCGPVGDCNTVQQSEYARLFGVLPIGALGISGYAAIISAWLIERRGHAPLDRLAAVALVLLTGGGTLFSIYLTFLEPFVIGATCAWCLTSAILMTLLLLLTVTPRRRALIRGRTD